MLHRGRKQEIARQEVVSTCAGSCCGLPKHSVIGAFSGDKSRACFNQRYFRRIIEHPSVNSLLHQSSFLFEEESQLANQITALVLISSPQFAPFNGDLIPAPHHHRHPSNPVHVTWMRVDAGQSHVSTIVRVYGDRGDVGAVGPFNLSHTSPIVFRPSMLRS